jgi:hypothetical protein
MSCGASISLTKQLLRFFLGGNSWGEILDEIFALMIVRDLFGDEKTI